MWLRCLLIAMAASALLLAAAEGSLQAAPDPLTRFLDGLFKKNQPQPQPPPVVQRSRRPVPQTRKVPRKPAPATVVVRDAGEKVEANTFIAVIGDSLAQSLAGGLQEAFVSTRDIAVIDRATTATSLSLPQVPDWQDLTRGHEITRSGNAPPDTRPITVGVVFLGADEQRALADAGSEAPFGSPQWQTLYTERIYGLIRTFVDRGIPLVWVGLPPMKSEEHTQAAIALNGLFRDEVLSAGGVFVDTWAAFSNDDKGFSETGPDVKGQEARLRTPDGMGLTKAGARKMAYFVALEIRRLLQARSLSTVIATTGEPVQNPEELLSLPDVPGPVVIPVKPAAGPILPLARIRPAPDGQLLKSRPQLKGEAALLVQRVYGEGRAPHPMAGRADDFRWPHSARMAQYPSPQEKAMQGQIFTRQASMPQTAVERLASERLTVESLTIESLLAASTVDETAP